MSSMKTASAASSQSSSATMVNMSSAYLNRRPAGQSVHSVATTTTTTADSSTSRTANDTGSSTELEQQQQEEGVLRDVLQELDKERTRRAELEAQIRQIQAEKLTLQQEMQVIQANATAAICSQTSVDKEKEESEISRRAFFAMEAQVQGYQQLVDALTLGKPAIAHAAAQEKAELTTLSSLNNPSTRQRRKDGSRQQQTASSKGVSTSSISSSSFGTHAHDIELTPTLPLHVVRLLEVMPWDTAKTRMHIFGKEEMYEWQVWNDREQSWSSSNIKYFPRIFQTMPIATGTKAVAAASSTNNNNATTGTTSNNSIGRGGGKHDNHHGNNLLVFLAGGGDKKPIHLPTKHGVLTDANMKYILNIEAGYPLPNDGGVWQWVGGWRIEKRVVLTPIPDDNDIHTKHLQQISGPDGIMPVSANPNSDHDGNSSNHHGSGNGSSNSGIKVRNKVDCDENGWSYATAASHFQTHPTELVWDNPGGNCGHEAADNSSTANNATNPIIIVERKIRRRKWSRQRILVDYPHASEGTKQYLKLLAENARLTLTANKVSDQLVETKLSLTETEEKLESTRTEMAHQMALLQQEILEKTQLLQEAGVANDKAVLPPSRSSSSSSSHAQNALQELFNKSEHGKQRRGSKFSQWIHGSSGRNNSDDASTASNDSVEDNPLQSDPSNAHISASANATTVSAELAAAAAAATITSSISSTGSGGSSNGVFDWRKVGPGSLLDKFKPVAASSNKNDNTATTTTMLSSTRRSFFRKGSQSSNLDHDDGDDSIPTVSDSIQNIDNKNTDTETGAVFDDESVSKVDGAEGP